jgi:hypothetical protein
MGTWGEFQDGAHRDKFLAAAAAHRFGDQRRSTCGTRTRRGAPCGRPPLREGRGRCILHCGPEAARSYRARLYDAYLRGHLPAEEWRKQEERRAANRLKDRWKRDPWLPGRTIDLLDHEQNLEAWLAAEGWSLLAIAPAVQDWLRWRYRRTMVDRTNHSRWVAVVRGKLAERVAKAGARPVEAGLLGNVQGERASRERCCRTSAKRRRPDGRKAIGRTTGNTSCV